MNKTYLCVLPLTLFLAASSGYSGVQEPDCIIDKHPMPPCLGDPRVPMVNLNVKSMHIAPRCVRANPGTTIVFRLTPKAHVELNTVKISPKDDTDDADDWLVGDNSTYKDLIIVSVPNEEEGIELGDYDYAIKTSDKCKDPRVHVER